MGTVNSLTQQVGETGTSVSIITVVDSSGNPINSGNGQQVTITNANANGQSTMAGGAPVTLPNNQTGIGTLAAPNINESWVQNAIRNGQGYMAGPITNLVTATNTSLNVCALSIFNPSNSGKSVLVYSFQVMTKDTASPGSVLLRQTTSDPYNTSGFTNLLTPLNLKFGGAATAGVTACSSPSGITASITQTGSIILETEALGNTAVELLSDGLCFVLPAGSAYGLELILFVSNVGSSFGGGARWIEF